MDTLAHTLEQRISACSACPRLRSHCQNIAHTKKRMFASWEYWGRPVPNFGDPQAELVIVGLAPAAHGANRTGRMFTGDQSGLWLYRALHRAGFANQPTSERRDDGLTVLNCLVTAVCHCAPPDNKPSPGEIKNCEPFLMETLQQANRKKIILALGQIAWTRVLAVLQKQYDIPRHSRVSFSHGSEMKIGETLTLLASYHPSQQNTFTGKLTEADFDRIFTRCRALLKTK